MNPVEATYTPEGWVHTGISYEDYARMHKQSLDKPDDRRLETPLWALNDDDLREVMVFYYEARSRIARNEKSGKVWRTNAPADATLQQRLDRAVARLQGPVRRYWEATLTRLSRAYVEEKKGNPNSPRLRRLAEQIETADTSICFDQIGSGIVLRVVHLYHRLHWDSVKVAAETNLKPPHIRQLLYRLAEVWPAVEGIRNGTVKVLRKEWNRAEMQFGPDGLPIGKQQHYCDFCGILIPPRWSARTLGQKKRAPKSEPSGRENHHFCSSEHRARWQNGERKTETVTAGFGIPLEQARQEAVSNPYHKYIEFCGRLGIDPMPEHMWESTR